MGVLGDMGSGRFVIKIPEMNGAKYVGRDGMVYSPGDAVQFKARWMARKRGESIGNSWADDEHKGQFEIEEVPTLRQPIEGSSHGPVKRIPVPVVTSCG